MPRYKVNASFGPWSTGDEFESSDPLHAAMAEGSALLTEVASDWPRTYDPPDDMLLGDVPSWAPPAPDAPSAEESEDEDPA